MPPQKSGISDYSFDLLQELARQVELVAVVRDDVVGLVRAPSGVLVAGASAYVAGRVGLRDLDIYQMGNHPWFHGYMHTRAMHTPGLLVLHDVALLDFYAGACGSMDSPVLMEEARLEDPEISDHLPTVVVDGRKEPDRLSSPLARRLIEASLLTIVHSASLQDQLRAAVPGGGHPSREPAGRNLESPRRAGSRPAGQIVFGIFGSLDGAGRYRGAERPSARVHESFPGRARLVIAGRPDNPGIGPRRAGDHPLLEDRRRRPGADRPASSGPRGGDRQL